MRIRKPNAAEVLAVTALVVASSGSAVAASRYLITSSAQIKPSAIRQLAQALRGETAEPKSPWAISQAGIGVVGAVATCPPGYEDVSGGYFADLPNGWRVISQQKFGDAFHVTAASLDPHPAEQAKLQVTAYCRSAP